MNYQKIYDSIINYRIDNQPEGYNEKHHIIPRSFGGTDDVENLVRLTPREHFICHWLLTKIHQTGRLHHKAIHAFAMMMWRHGKKQERYRCSSRTYEYLKIQYSKVLSKSQKGEKNSNFGMMWICNVELKENAKISKNSDIPDGWVKGRNKWNKDLCIRCGDVLLSKRRNTTSTPLCQSCKTNLKIQKTKDDYKKISDVWKWSITNNVSIGESAVKAGMQVGVTKELIKKFRKELISDYGKLKLGRKCKKGNTDSISIDNKSKRKYTYDDIAPKYKEWVESNCPQIHIAKKYKMNLQTFRNYIARYKEQLESEYGVSS